MRAVVQRVLNASVTVSNRLVGEIKKGIVVFVGISQHDNAKDINYIADKILNMRIFQDNDDKMNLSVQDIKGEILIISQFTLYGDIRKGRRPSFSDAALPDKGKEYYIELIENIRHSSGLKVETGEFGALMSVNYINDGPVTILVDSAKTF